MPLRGSLPRVGQFDFHFQHLQVVLALQIDLDVIWINLDVLADHGHQVTLQRGQIVRCNHGARARQWFAPKFVELQRSRPSG